MNNVSFESTKDVTVCVSFEKMGLVENLLRGIFSFGIFYFLLSPLFLSHISFFYFSRIPIQIVLY